MKTILVATDFSPAALNAANYAADMALAIHADIFLLHIYQMPVGYAEVPVAVNINDLIKDAGMQLNHIKDILIKRTDGKIKIAAEVREGAFFQELKTFCENIKPYTVIMGSQGTTAAERLFFGNHTVRAMKRLEWPLITVPNGARYSAIKKIGLACDFNKVVDTTPVEEIKTLVSDFNAELHVLNTGKKTEFAPDTVFESALLQEMIGSLNPSYHFITNDNTDEGIMDFAEKNSIDLLLVLPKRHSLLDKLISKSHTRQLVLHSHVPVMAIHQ
ncbi:universal stress protein [Agriterribacter sp.]|uniref:universal stress protein n=1 Tax=Agriterribacter sp. TaxID=2821509 RepID=UPI002CF75E16|nr:universal stress protein [Agriterribacter sp.]HRO47546.1 universal stress protein [Agriterribacter sp.]HRQ16995.1 universal stress protein [Agriterribacter sp.]